MKIILTCLLHLESHRPDKCENGAGPSVESALGTPLEIAQRHSFPENQQNAEEIEKLLKSTWWTG
ncbi:hypothetical protein HUB94_22095 (plasmid) [Paenibacillus cellulosilyticus]|uniref:hypothetical protein n=1 Tax=Paenibacillus cellulosilyticus TaxID=375489 RepID=UPI0011B3CDD2|nr:hypothetical protein [Paenibacillus cellulosilyticus]QKS47142.1 hypothetical protein HUB94_22095 [Paenibacillus cellulosilyticus]